MSGFNGRYRVLFAVASVTVPAVLCVAFLRDVSPTAEARPTRPASRTSVAAIAAARIRIEALGTQRTGITGRPRVQADRSIPAEETVVLHLGAGDEADPTNACNARFIDAADVTDSRLVWRFEVKLLESPADRTTMQLHWTRYRPSVENKIERDEVGTITLGPNDSHVLDYVENGPSSPCASLLIRISAQPILEQEGRPISVDVWTVDENTAGQARSVHQHLHGVTGEAIRFKFMPLDFAGNGTGPRVSMGVEGTLQAVDAQDGQIDISLQALRRTSWAGAETRGEGRVQFRAATGETAALLLPQPTGTLGGPGASAGLTPAALDLTKAFAGHRLSLYVKIESLR